MNSEPNCTQCSTTQSCCCQNPLWHWKVWRVPACCPSKVLQYILIQKDLWFYVDRSSIYFSLKCPLKMKFCSFEGDAFPLFISRIQKSAAISNTLWPSIKISDIPVSTCSLIRLFDLSVKYPTQVQCAVISISNFGGSGCSKSENKNMEREKKAVAIKDARLKCVCHGLCAADFPTLSYSVNSLYYYTKFPH